MQLALCWIAGLSLCFLTAWAAPSDNGGGQALDVNTTSNSTTLSSDPGNGSDDQRSIQDIVWSCLATIFACTWVSIHPNIPPLNHSRIQKFSRRVGITILALIAPELIVIWALRQWLVSRRVAREYAELGWEQVHGFFALMGGFMLYNKDGVPFKVLHLHRLAFFRLKPELRIPAEDIWDKSKGDVLAKGLVVLQTMWFILQCIARASRGLAITQLEVLTLAFAALNFVIYGLWWNKPLGVQRPVRITIDNEAETGFLKLSGFREHRPVYSSFNYSLAGPIRHVYRWLGLQLIERIIEGSDDNGFPKADDTVSLDHASFVSTSPAISISFASFLESHAFTVSTSLPAISIFEASSSESHEPFTVSTSPPAISNPSASFSDSHESFTVSTSRPAIVNSADKLLGVPTFYSESYIHPRIYRKTLIFLFTRSPALFATPIAVAFGAIHFISWSSVFSTKAEQRLWHISTIVLIAVPLFPVLWLLSLNLIRCGFRVSRIMHWTTRLAVLFYIVARLYLIVEAFASLRSLPPSAFQTVEWTSFIPHV